MQGKGIRIQEQWWFAVLNRVIRVGFIDIVIEQGLERNKVISHVTGGRKSVTSRKNSQDKGHSRVPVWLEQSEPGVVE